MIVNSKGEVYIKGVNIFDIAKAEYFDDFTCIPALNNIVEIDIGYSHALAINDENDIYAFGWNEFYQTGQDTSNQNLLNQIHTESKVISISTGDSFSMFLDDKGDLYGFGGNRLGQLKESSLKDRIEPIKIEISK